MDNPRIKGMMYFKAMPTAPLLEEPRESEGLLELVKPFTSLLRQEDEHEDEDD